MIHVVWSDNFQRYERSIIKTQFADVIICIYPLDNSLYYIEIDVKQGVIMIHVLDSFNF